MNQNISNIINKENNTPNLDKKEKYNDSKSFLRTPFRYSDMSKAHTALRNSLEKINENEEDNYNSINTKIKNETVINKESQEIINDLKKKIAELENQVVNLRKKNDMLTRDNIENDSKIQRMSFVGTRRKFNLGFSGEKNNSIEIAEIIKEKNDLQEINEKMLNMLTEKELENEELQENFETYKNNMKLEIEKYLDIINELQEKVEIYEENDKNEENIDNNLNEIINEYNSYKERMEKTIGEYIKKEEELNIELENKENCIYNLKNEIQNLELENIQLQNKTEQKEKDCDEELMNIDIIVAENEKLKNEILILEEKIKTNEEKMKMNLSAKEDEIKILNQDLEFKKKNLNKVKEEKNKEINLLKNEINKCNKDINNLIKKNEIIQREDEEIKVKNNILQNKLDKKTKE